MSAKSIIGGLSLLFLLTEAIVMVAMAQLGVATEDVWQRALWDVTADTLIIVPAICFWWHWKQGATPSQLSAIAVKTTLIIILVEGATEHLLQIQPLPLTAWHTILVDSLIFAVMAPPAVYYLALRPLISQQRPYVRSLSVPACIALSVLTSFAVLVFDMSLPLGVAGGVPYVALVLVGLWFPQRNAAIGLALVGTALTITGYVLSAEMGIPWMVLTNRGLAIFAIWVTASLVVKHKRDIQELDLAAIVFNEAAGGITITDTNNNIVAINPAFTKITGYSLEDVVGRNPRTLQSGRHDKDFYRNMWQSLHDTGSWQGEIWNRNKAGQVYPERLSLAVLKDPKGRIVNHIALFQDITEQKQIEQALEDSEKKYRALYSNSGIGFVVVDDTFHFVDANKKFLNFIGYSLDELRTMTPLDITHPDNVEETADILDHSVIDGVRVHKLDKRYVHKDGKVLWGHAVSTQLELASGEILNFASIADITDRKLMEENLKHLANHDGLTGLPTARLGMDRLSGALATARRSKSMAALMFIDLDGFKAVNDTFGHETGDQLLKAVSDRISSCIREVDTVARVGGDEFMIVLANIVNRAGAEKVAQSVIDAIDQPFKLQDHVATVGASIGIALYPDHGEQPEALLKRADEAMYAVKRTGKNNYEFAAD